MKRFKTIIRILAFATIVFTTTNLVGCSYIKKINIPNGYVLNDNHPYDIIETENGIDIVLHFKGIENE